MTTASVRSTEMTPSATATGRYEDANGITAAATPRDVNGSRIAVTTWRATKATESRARLRCRPTVRNRGQFGDCARATARRPRQATPLNRISETMPEPRVANQRIWVLIGWTVSNLSGNGLRTWPNDRPGDLSIRLRAFGAGGCPSPVADGGRDDTGGGPGTSGSGQPPTRTISPVVRTSRA